MSFHKFIQNINNAVSGSLGTDQGTAESKTFSGKNAFAEIADTFVLSVQITDLTSAYADISGRYVCISADIFAKFCHKALAERHNFSVRFTFGVKVGTALAAADRKAGQGVFEDLLKSQEFQNALVYRGMETKTALIRSDGAVELNAVAFIYLYVSFVVCPRNAEGDDSFRLYQAFKNSQLAVFFFIFVNNDLQGIKNFLYCLMEFRFAWILRYDSLVNFFSVRHNNSSSSIL